MGYDLFLSLFTLVLKLFQNWPAGVLSGQLLVFLFCLFSCFEVSYHSSSTSFSSAQKNSSRTTLSCSVHNRSKTKGGTKWGGNEAGLWSGWVRKCLRRKNTAALAWWKKKKARISHLSQLGLTICPRSTGSF